MNKIEQHLLEQPPAILVTKIWESEMSRSDDFTEDIAPKSGANIQFDPRIFLSKAGNARTISHYRANEVVYSQGDPADSVFYIQDGTTKVTVFSERGKEAIVWLPGAGDFFGEGCLAGQESRQATVSTRTECVIVRLAKACVIRVIREEPAFAELFISHLVARNIRAEEDLVDQLFNSSEKRLARVLLSLANFDKEGRLESIPVKISQEMLAEMIGTTRARVSFFMNRFRKLGFIDYKSHIKVHRSLFSVLLTDKSETQTIRSNTDGQLSRLASATGQLAGRRGGAHLPRLRDVQVASVGGTRRRVSG
jgi:CRP-like cAMP-binding protein